MPVTSVETGISQEISPNEKNEKKEKKISGEICSEMPVTTEVTGISPEISPYNPAIVSEGEISSEMPVSTEETGISQEIPLKVIEHSNEWIAGEIMALVLDI